MTILKVLYKKRDAARAQVDKWNGIIKMLESELGIKPEKDKPRVSKFSAAARRRLSRRMKAQWKNNRAKMLGKKS